MGRGNSNLFSTTFGAKSLRNPSHFIKVQLFAINKEKQSRHSENNTSGKSILFGGETKAQEIIDKYGGKGKNIGSGKERVVCKEVIGIYKNPQTGESSLSTVAIIVRSKTGDHVYPGNPSTKDATPTTPKGGK